MKYQRTLTHYNSNVDKIVQIQNFVKNKLVGDAYRKLSKYLFPFYTLLLYCIICFVSVQPTNAFFLFYLATDSNPSIGTVKNFIHLLDDSDLDFDRELGKYQSYKI